MNNILQVTTAHSRYDVRIFKKISLSLSKYFKTELLVVDSIPNERINKNLSIFSIRQTNSRLRRFFILPIIIFIEIFKNHKNKIIHLHDPELILMGFFLRFFNFKVIYDSHEDLPKQVLSKPYLHKIFKIPLSYFINFFEKIFLRKFNFLIAATDSINQSLINKNENVYTINNYPIIEKSIKAKKELNSLIYVGAISEIRGIKQLIKALELSNKISHLNLVGSFNSTKVYNEVKSYRGWNKVRYFGQLDRESTKKILSKSEIGIVTFLPEPNHIKSQPNKLFEYMENELPVIISDFEKWKIITNKYKCGLTVNPKSPESISNAIDILLGNRKLIKKMSANSRKAVINNFSWESEEKKLINLYYQI